eukprot:Nitzschia sp. Nitz4//scaffold118_size93875//35256//37041//NITZ4_004785-RA/size93875-augustus-gene-0.95-mRNA-1//-1//CDS//3329533715//3294//frame0
MCYNSYTPTIMNPSSPSSSSNNDGFRPQQQPTSQENFFISHDHDQRKEYVSTFFLVGELEQQAHVSSSSWATHSATTNPPTWGTTGSGAPQYSNSKYEETPPKQSNSTMAVTSSSTSTSTRNDVLTRYGDPISYNKNMNDYNNDNSLWSTLSRNTSLQQQATQTSPSRAESFGRNASSQGTSAPGIAPKDDHQSRLSYYHGHATPTSAPRTTIGTSMITPTLSTSTHQPRAKLGRRPSPGVLLARVKPMKFAERIYTMLEDAEHENFETVIRWEPDGKSFKVHDTRVFEEEIQPRYLNQTKLRSFQRKLILHGFSRIQGGPSLGAYHHRFFIRGERLLCRRIQRQDQQQEPHNGGNTTGSTSRGTSEDHEECSSSVGSTPALTVRGGDCGGPAPPPSAEEDRSTAALGRTKAPPPLPSLFVKTTTSGIRSSTFTTPLLSSSEGVRADVSNTTREPLEMAFSRTSSSNRGATSPNNTLPATAPMLQGGGDLHNHHKNINTKKNNSSSSTSMAVVQQDEDDTATTRWLFERMLDSYTPPQPASQDKMGQGPLSESVLNDDPFSPRPLP